VRNLVALLIAATILAGCTRSGSAGSPSGSGARHPWTHPGILRIASLGDPDSLSPLIGTFQVDVDLSMFWAGYLFNYDDRNQLVPELATSVPTLANGGIAQDGRTITYHLRRGVLWQDGATFSADDVVFSWHAVMNPNTNVQTRTGYDDIRAIDEPDKYTLVVHLIRPFAPFVNSFFTMGATPYPVYPKHLLAQYGDLNHIPYNSKPVGTGPFIVSEWHRGQTLRMVANPHYWRGPPKLREVDYTNIPDENTLLTSVRTHEIDLWYNASATNYPAASHIPGTRALLTPFTQYSIITFNTRHPIVSEEAVRRALALATDRKHLIDVVTYGVQVPGDGDQPAFSWAHNPTLRSIPFDLARSRATLDAAGWKAGPDGIRTKAGRRLHLDLATTSGDVLGNRVAVLLQAAWRSVGVDLEIRTYATGMMFANYSAGGILQAGRFDVSQSSWVNGIDPDDSTNVTCTAIPPNGQNIARFCDREVEEQERIALESFDQSVRRRAYARVQQILVDRVPQLTRWFFRRFDVMNVDLRNYRPAHAVTTFWNTWEYSI
jgi:peptide/nickel transport system substrate-binding protein